MPLCSVLMSHALLCCQNCHQLIYLYIKHFYTSSVGFSTQVYVVAVCPLYTKVFIRLLHVFAMYLAYQELNKHPQSEIRCVQGHVHSSSFPLVLWTCVVASKREWSLCWWRHLRQKDWIFCATQFAQRVRSPYLKFLKEEERILIRLNPLQFCTLGAWSEFSIENTDSRCLLEYR